MCRLKLKSELKLFGFNYRVTAISGKGVLFTLAEERKTEAAKELMLSLSEVENLVFN